jgi:hypothetical protein
MAESKPEMEPGGAPATPSNASGTGARPSATPPAGGAPAGATAPPLPTGATADAAPSLRPGAGVGITAWQNNARITALWSINQNRNSWVHVDGVGWKKLANNSDSGIVALTMLGAHARDRDRIVNYREEADGMIHEIYVW